MATKLNSKDPQGLSELRDRYLETFLEDTAEYLELAKWPAASPHHSSPSRRHVQQRPPKAKTNPSPPVTTRWFGLARRALS